MQRNKTRLVVLGNTQQEGMYFTETFAPSIKWSPFGHYCPSPLLRNGRFTIWMCTTPFFMEKSTCGHLRNFNPLLRSSLVACRNLCMAFNRHPDAGFLNLLLPFGNLDSNSLMHIILYSRTMLGTFFCVLIYIDDLLIIGRPPLMCFATFKETRTKVYFSFLILHLFWRPIVILISPIVRLLAALSLYNLYLLVVLLFLGKTKKQPTIFRSSVEAKYRSMAVTLCELKWLWCLLWDFRVPVNRPILLHYDNQAAIYIAANFIFQEWTKHIEIDCRFIRDVFKFGLITLSYIHIVL